MAILVSIEEFEEIAENPNQMRSHLANRLYIQACDEASHGGRIIIDEIDEYYLEESYEGWQEDLAGIEDVYAMVQYALNVDPDNDEADVWEEFLG